ncbi:MAG: YhcH/YjgK/YiaL family protein [Prevotellaceae bacterium]|jgi:YhcH/YjgK/YiaL family protein|nr:YhcH/YjgK/YiaL family protein [Prevotellaceae bacterium]
MVVDTLENLEKYTALHPLFAQVAAFVKANDLHALETGKIALQGSDLVVNVQNPNGKKKEEARLETHRDFIDIQLPLSATEIMGYTPAAKCLPADAPYNAEKDITFFEGLADSYVAIEPGMFAIFFPQDGHAPCIAQGPIKKIVVKVRL